MNDTETSGAYRIVPVAEAGTGRCDDCSRLLLGSCHTNGENHLCGYCYGQRMGYYAEGAGPEGSE